MKTRRYQGTRSKVVTLEVKLSFYELTDITMRLRDVNSNNSVWTQFVKFMEAALEDAEEPKS